MSKHPRRASAGRIGGMTLIELMVAMLLGLVLIGGATSVLLANRQSYRTNEGLSQLQESARTAFELMARDIRQAGVTGCDSNGRIANIVQTDSGTEWWQNWFGMEGFGATEADGATTFGTDPGQRVSGTHSLLVQGLEGNGLTVKAHVPANATIELNAATTGVAAGDLMLICDFDHATIFAVNSYNSADNLVDYRVNATVSPRNCSTGLGYPANCTTNNPWRFKPSSQLSRLMAVDWYVGNNGRNGGRSLFRWRAGAANADEMVVGVSGMQLRYLEEGQDDFDATVTNWANVTAVEVTLTIDSADQRISNDAAVNSGRLQRSFTNVITLRNRVS